MSWRPPASSRAPWGVEQDDQELLRGAFGFTSRMWNIPATVETRFDTASITCRRCR